MYSDFVMLSYHVKIFRFKREEIKIQAWESQEKAKLEAEMRRIEVILLLHNLYSLETKFLHIIEHSQIRLASCL